MKVLVTGGAGFIGSSVVKVLEKKGAKVIVLDNFSSGNFKNLKDTKAEVIAASLLKENLFKKLPKVNAIIHEAAITDTTLKSDERMICENVEGFKNVLQFCLKKNIKLVYASSAGVYGNGPTPMRENQHLSPLNAYAYSKYLCDKIASSVVKKSSAPLIVGLRYFNVYGEGEYHKGKAASMIYQLYWQMRNKSEARIFKYGEQKRDFIYVRDVARITTSALDCRSSAIINVGCGEARSFNEVVAILNKVLKKNIKCTYFDNPYEEVYQNHTEADISLLYKKLKIKPEYSLQKGIETYISQIEKDEPYLWEKAYF